MQAVAAQRDSFRRNTSTLSRGLRSKSTTGAEDHGKAAAEGRKISPTTVPSFGCSVAPLTSTNEYKYNQIRTVVVDAGRSELLSGAIK